MSSQIRTLNSTLNSNCSEEEFELFSLLSNPTKVEQLGFSDPHSSPTNHTSGAAEKPSHAEMAAKELLATRNSVKPETFRDDLDRGRRSRYGSKLSHQLWQYPPIRYAGVKAMIDANILPLKAELSDKLNTNEPTKTISASLSQVAAAFGPAEMKATSDKDECPRLQQEYNFNTRCLMNHPTIKSLLEAGKDTQHTGTLFDLISRTFITADAFGKTLLATIGLINSGVHDQMSWNRDAPWCRDVQNLSKLVLDETNVIAEGLGMKFDDQSYNYPPFKDFSSQRWFKKQSAETQKFQFTSALGSWKDKALQGSSEESGENQPGLLPGQNFPYELLRSFPTAAEDFFGFLKSCRDVALRTEKMVELYKEHQERKLPLAPTESENGGGSSV